MLSKRSPTVPLLVLPSEIPAVDPAAAAACAGIEMIRSNERLKLAAQAAKPLTSCRLSTRIS
jgi:hypothetical protein